MTSLMDNFLHGRGIDLRQRPVGQQQQQQSAFGLPVGAETDPLLNGKGRPASTGACNAMVWVFIGLLTLGVGVGIVLGAVALDRVSPNGVFENTQINTTELNAHQLTSTNISGNNLVVDHVASQTITTQTLTGDAVTAGMVTADKVTTGMITTDVVCPTVLEHTSSGVIPPTHEVHSLLQDQTATLPPAVAAPVDAAPLGPLPSVDTPIEVGMQARAQQAPVEIIDRGSGVQWFQLGRPEPVFLGPSGADVNGVEPPEHDETASVRITVDFASLPPGAAGFLVDIELDVSCEEGFDFVFIRKNGVIIADYTGSGQTASDPFVSFTFTDLAIVADDVVVIEYSKDFIYNGGFDYAIVRPVNMRYVSNGVAMTLPADLTPYVGKSIKICSGDLRASSLELEGSNKFDDFRRYNYVSLRPAPGANPCCITLHIPKGGQVHVVSRDQCAIYCTDANQILCIDPDRPEETNPFHGWWRAYTKAQAPMGVEFENRAAPYFKLDMLQDPPVATVYTGTVNNPRTPNSRDPSNGVLQFSQLNSTTLASTLSRRLIMQPDQTTILAELDTTGSGSAIIGPTIYKKISQADVPRIIPFSSGTTTGLGPDDPRSILRAAADIAIYGANSHLAKDRVDENWVGIDEANALLEKIIAEGSSHTTDVHEVYPTQSADIPVTKIRTIANNHVTTPTTVVIAGCTGTYASMNGEHEVFVHNTAYNPIIDPLYQDYVEGVPANSSYHHDVTIYFDSYGFPEDADGAAFLSTTGPCTLSVQYGPITAASEYAETVGAYAYWIMETMKVILHNRWFIQHDPASRLGGNPGFTKPFLTWDALAAHLANVSTPTIGRHTSRRHMISSEFMAGMAKQNGFFALFDPDPFIAPTDRGNYGDVNNRFGIRMWEDILNVTGRFFYDVPLENYVVDMKTLTFTCEGNSKTAGINLILGLVWNSQVPGQGCDTIAPLMVDYGTVPPAGYSFFHTYIPPNAGGSDSYSLFSPLALELAHDRAPRAGRINPAYTGGRNIGYLRIHDRLEGSSSVGGTFSTSATLTPPGLESSPRANREAQVRVVAALMKHLLDLGCEHVIIDTRSNDGGTFDVSVRELFGTEDTTYGSLDQFATLTDDTRGNTVKLNDLDRPGTHTTQLLPILRRVLPSLTEAYYPGSVLTDGEVIVMTDFSAGSGGDIFPNLFLGSNLDKELGGNTRARIVGDIDGRLAGAVNTDSVPFSRDSPRLRYSNGDAVCPLVFQTDYGSGTTRLDGSWNNNRHPSLQPECTPTLRGNSGGCAWPNDYETVLYPDLGYKSNPRPRLPGDTRPQTPDPNNRSEWRDTWLEEAIRTALVAPVPVRRRRDTLKSQQAEKKGYRAPKRSKREVARKIHKRDVSCPSGVTLRSYAAEPRTVMVKVKPAKTQELRELAMADAIRRAGKIVDDEFASGGLCIDDNDEVMITPQCSGLPALVIPEVASLRESLRQNSTAGR